MKKILQNVNKSASNKKAYYADLEELGDLINYARSIHDEGGVKLSAFFYYVPEKDGGVIVDAKGIEYGAIADFRGGTDLFGFHIGREYFGDALFADDFFDLNDDGEGDCVFATEERAVSHFFNALIPYLKNIVK